MGKLAMFATRPAIATVRAVCWGSDGGDKQDFALAWPLMPPLPRPSASPLPSWASRPATPHTPVVPFTDACKAIWRWLRGVQPGWRERFAEQRLIERLAQELDEGDRKEERKTKGKGRDGATAT